MLPSLESKDLPHVERALLLIPRSGCSFQYLTASFYYTYILIFFHAQVLFIFYHQCFKGGYRNQMLFFSWENIWSGTFVVVWCSFPFPVRLSHLMHHLHRRLSDLCRCAALPDLSLQGCESGIEGKDRSSCEISEI